MNMEKPTTKRITFDEMPNVIAQLSVDILEMSNALHILMEEVEGLREHIMAKPVSARRIPVSLNVPAKSQAKPRIRCTVTRARDSFLITKEERLCTFSRTNCLNGYGTAASKPCLNVRTVKTETYCQFKLSQRQSNNYYFPIFPNSYQTSRK